MTANSFTWALSLLFLAITPGQLHPEDSDADRKLFEQIRAKAEKGDAEAQGVVAFCYIEGKGVAKDMAEAMKWSRRAAEQGQAEAQYNLGVGLFTGRGVEKNVAEAVKWWRKAADQGDPDAQYSLGICYSQGKGTVKDDAEAVKWYRKAAEQGHARAQRDLGVCFSKGQAVTKDEAEAARWFSKSAYQGDEQGQFALGLQYAAGNGLTKDWVEAHRWFNLASAQGNAEAKRFLLMAERHMTPGQKAEAERLAREFKPRRAPPPRGLGSHEEITPSRPSASGTGFFITEDGYLITNEHVAGSGAQVRLVTPAGLIPAKVIKVDSGNDLALLKAEGTFTPLPVVPSRAVKLGTTVATVGFPNIGLQGFAPKFARGEIAALSGAQDDTRYFQISVPVQPGNSGGALVDDRGNVVGVVSAKLSASVALATSGSLPENVNYAVKSSFLLGFLESLPAVSANLTFATGRGFEEFSGCDS